MTPLQPAAEPFHDLVEESLEEAIFLWRRWHDELASLTRNLDEVWSWTEDRLHGALDGVRVGNGLDLALEGLHSDEHDRIAVCAGVLASSPDQTATEAIVAVLQIAEGETLSATLRGLELLGSNPALRAAAQVLADRGGAGAAGLCRLKAFRRVAPGPELHVAFTSGIPAAQVDALRAALSLPSRQAAEMIASALRHDDGTVRLAAIEVGMARGMNDAWQSARRTATQLDGAAGPCLPLLAMFGTADDHELVYTALPLPAVQRQAIRALGHIGTVRAIEACLAGMHHDTVARACGEAYCWITGADLVRDRLAADETPPDVPAFEDDDLDANLVPEPDALWPLPDPEAVRRDWLGRRSAFAPEMRHIQGRPASDDLRMALVESGPMLRRPDLVLELRVSTQGRYDVETRAFAQRQRHMMTAGRAAVAGTGGN